MRRNQRIILSATILLVCFFASRSQAAIILSVDFDTATPGYQSTRPSATGQTVLASIFMELTGTTTLSAYQFSVLFDKNELSYVANSRSEPVPAGFGFFETDPQNTVDLANGVLKFFGADTGAGPDASNVAQRGPYLVATASFLVTTPVGSTSDIDINAARLISEGDDFLLNGSGAVIPTSELIFNGGSITPVPEPSSLALLGGCAAVLAMGRRNRLRMASRS